jgi:hypothetical protein
VATVEEAKSRRAERGSCRDDLCAAVATVEAAKSRRQATAQMAEAIDVDTRRQLMPRRLQRRVVRLGAMAAAAKIR